MLSWHAASFHSIYRGSLPPALPRREIQEPTVRKARGKGRIQTIRCFVEKARGAQPPLIHSVQSGSLPPSVAANVKGLLSGAKVDDKPFMVLKKRMRHAASFHSIQSGCLPPSLAANGKG